MIDAEKLKTRDGMEYVASLPKGEVAVGMELFDGELFVMTKTALYKLEDKKRLEKQFNL